MERPSTQAAPHTDAPPPVSIWERRWARLRFHVLLHLLALVLMLSAHFLLHHFRNDTYRADVEPLLESAAAEYLIDVDPETRRFALRRATLPVEGGDDVGAAGRAGLGKLPSIAGLLGSVEARVEELNTEIARLVRAKASAFVAEQGDTHRAPAAAFAAEAATGQWVYAPFRPDPPQDLALDSEGFVRLREALTVSRVIDFTQFTELIHADEFRDTPALHEDMLALSAKYGERLDVTEEARPHLVAGLDEEWCCTLATLGQFLRSLRRDDAVAADSSEECDDEADADAPTDVLCLPDCDQSLTTWNRDLHHRMARLARDELGWFWIYGNWRWLEIVLLTMFGVLVEAAVRLGLQMTGRTADPAEVWEPAETGRSLLKLLYAPIMSLVSIWTLIATDFIEIDVVGASSATAIVTLAFLFGLFPNLPYSLFNRLAVAIFQHTSVAADPRSGESATKTVKSISDVELGAPPDFRELKAKIVEHVTAPLKR